MTLTEQQEAALQRLTTAGDLTPIQADAVRRAFDGTAPAARRHNGWLVEVGGYLGGGLMLAATAMYLGTSWEDLGRGARAGILAATASVFYAAALVISGGSIRRLTGARRRAVGVLLSLPAIPAASAVGVAASDHAAVWSTGTGLVLGLVGLALLSNPLGVLITAGMSASLVVAVGTDVVDASPLAMGLSFLVLGAAWAAVALAGLRPRNLTLVLGLGLALTGAQLPLEYQGGTRAVAYALTLGVAAACLALYRFDRSLLALAVGVIAVTLAVPEAVSDATDGALSGPTITMIAGVVLVGASAAGTVLHRARRLPEPR